MTGDTVDVLPHSRTADLCCARDSALLREQDILQYADSVEHGLPAFQRLRRLVVTSFRARAAVSIV